jgi:glycosyltransferase involved in cell wall biosynthesis
MKICVIGNDYKQQLPLIGYGGIETAFENLCYGIHKYFSDNIQFCAFVPKIIEQKEKKPLFKVIETNYIESSKSGVRPIHFVSEIRDIIKNSNIKPDIIWSYSHWSALTLQELNIPIICNMMDSGGWEENKFIYKENVYYRFASKFIYDLTFKDADTFEHINKIKKQSFWLHTGISDEEYCFEPNKDNYILWVAGLNWGWQGKGLDIFLRLAQERSDQQFVAYGTGSTQIEEQLKIVSKQLKNFEYLGPLERGEKHKNVFKKAKLFTFLTQTTEAFGMTGVEAISKGTPVLGTKNGSLPEIYEPICCCTNDFKKMLFQLDVSHNYQDIYNHSLKFHSKNEIKYLYNKSKSII